VRWAYFDADGVCRVITTMQAPELNWPHEVEVPDDYKPNTTRLNLGSGKAEVFERPPIPPPVEEDPPWLARLKALEERVTKLEHP